MKTLSFSTHKGGPGKTVSAINIAAGLARIGKRTLLVDLDPQGHATLGLGLDVGLNEPSMADALQERGKGLDGILRKVDEFLSILPANIRLARVAEALYGAVRREERLSHALSGLAGEFEFAILDCPPSLGTLTANALAMADWVIIPCETGARAADGLMDLLDVLHDLRGEAFEKWRILINKLDPRKTVTNEAVLKALEPHKGRILKTQMGVSESLNQAQMRGEHIFQFEPTGKAARTFERLVGEIIGLT